MASAAWFLPAEKPLASWYWLLSGRFEAPDLLTFLLPPPLPFLVFPHNCTVIVPCRTARHQFHELRSCASVLLPDFFQYRGNRFDFPPIFQRPRSGPLLFQWKSAIVFSPQVRILILSSGSFSFIALASAEASCPKHPAVGVDGIPPLFPPSKFFAFFALLRM